MSQYVRIVEDIECEVNVPEETNVKISELHNKVVDAINNEIMFFVPEDLKNKMNQETFLNIKKDAINYGLNLLKDSELAYTPSLIEDVMNYMYDKIERIQEPDDDYSNFYMKVWGKKSEHAMIREQMKYNTLMINYSYDPMQFAIEETVDKAIGNGIPTNDKDVMVREVYNELYDYINQSEGIDVVVDDYMLKNSI